MVVVQQIISDEKRSEGTENVVLVLGQGQRADDLFRPLRPCHDHAGTQECPTRVRGKSAETRTESSGLQMDAMKDSAGCDRARCACFAERWLQEARLLATTGWS